jgi:D-glycero-D-manno-heptose 1,7-bisphosphate phosphatase
MRTAVVRQCAVLVGGLGTRLGALTASTPKPILPCGDRPFLAWPMREMLRFGVEEFLLLTGHLSDRLAQAAAEIAASLPRRVDVQLAEEPLRAGTGGALYHARDRLHERFLLCNGDSLFDCNLANLLAAAAEDAPPAVGRLMLRPLEDASRYGVVTLEGERIAAFREPPPAGTPGVINAGIYVFSRALLDLVQPVCSLERDVMPRLAAVGALRGTLGDGYFRDIGVPEDFARAQTEIPALLHRDALFLDAAMLDQAALPKLRRATQSGWHVFVLTDSGTRQAQRLASALRMPATIDDERRRGLGDPAASRTALRELLHAWEVDPARCRLLTTQQADLDAAAALGIPRSFVAAPGGGEGWSEVEAGFSWPPP